MHYGKIEPLNDREAASATGQQIEVLYASAGREIEIATRSKGAAGGSRARLLNQHGVDYVRGYGGRSQGSVTIP